MLIRIMGDFAPTYDINTVTFPEIDAVDFNIINLETPLVEQPELLEKNKKAGPCLVGNPLLFANFANSTMVVSLSNNHIMDYGKAGVLETIRHCTQQKAQYTGVIIHGNENKELILEKNGIKIGFLSVAEFQYGFSHHCSDGVIGYRWYSLLEQMKKLKKKVDHVIVSIHAASEMYPLPSPFYQDEMRGLIDNGASVIYGHHAHVPQGFEKYNNGLIYYGLGNFLVSPRRWRNERNTLWSIVSTIEFSATDCKEVFLDAFEILGDSSVVVKPCDAKEKQIHMEYISNINSILSDPEQLNSLWQENSIRLFETWYARSLGIKSECLNFGLFLTSLKKIAINFIMRRSYYQGNMLEQYHYFSCDSHKFAIETALGVLSGEIPDKRSSFSRKWFKENGI